jgi:acetoin:2,6-dichlorophenolindophenol oxidoreductase subunit alpha
MKINKKHLKDLFGGMLTIRRFEEAVTELYYGGEIPGGVHLYIGEEAIAVGACSSLNKDDFITSTHRGHGHLIAKGGDIKLMMAELLGKKSGYCKGKGGSMHIADLELGILGANGIVGGGIPIAVGAGYSAKLRGTEQICLAFFGDGASNEGAFHESLNMSSAWALPLIFLCENNKFGVSTRISRITNIEDLSKRANGYGIPGVRVDGMDVLEVEETAKKAIERARKGLGPTLIVADTFRYRGHFEGDKVNYWEEKELKEWMEKDPVRNTKNILLSEGVPESEFEAIEKEIKIKIDDAVKFARVSDFPKGEEALEDLFS